MVIARTTEGELGVLPGHAPLLGQLAEGGVVTVRTESGDDLVVAAHGGFLSVTERGVSVLAETAEVSTEIDVERAREALRRAQDAPDDPEAVTAARRRPGGLRSRSARSRDTRPDHDRARSAGPGPRAGRARRGGLPDPPPPPADRPGSGHHVAAAGRLAALVGGRGLVRRGHPAL